jgi:hypothetical protein
MKTEIDSVHLNIVSDCTWEAAARLSFDLRHTPDMRAGTSVGCKKHSRLKTPHMPLCTDRFLLAGESIY